MGSDDESCSGHCEAPLRADRSEDQLVSGELIQLGGFTAGLAIRADSLRRIADDLAVGLDVVVDQPVISTESRAGLLDGERLARERKILEHCNDLRFAKAASRTGGGGDGVDRLGGLIRGLRRLGGRSDRVLRIAVVGIHNQ